VEVIRESYDWPQRLQAGAVTIGNFDGVHAGHAKIIQRLVERSRVLGGPAVVFTFDPHPVRLLRPQQVPPPLTWTERKAQLLEELGIDFMIAYPTDEALLSLTAEEFFNRIVSEQLQAKALVEGPDFHFGKGRAGSIEMLHSLCNKADFSLDIVPPVQIEGSNVSSSRIRKLLLDGDVDQARRLLTHPYRIRGMVTHGARRGGKIGFPTANLDAIDTITPGVGVYAGRTMTPAGLRAAAIHIGPNPTFGEQSLKVEVHIIDWQGILYGEPLEVDFISRLRDIQRFDNVERLIEQLHNDIARTIDVNKQHQG